MKKLISLLMMILLLLTAALAETSTPTCTTVTLATGSVQVYDFGENRLETTLQEGETASIQLGQYTQAQLDGGRHKPDS